MNNNKLALKPDQIPLFLRAIAHNRKVVLEQISNGRFCDSDYFFVTEQSDGFDLVPPGRRDATLARSFDDYFAGSLVGALPFTGRHGSDGIKVSSTGKVTQVELKLCIKNDDRYSINEKGYLTVHNAKKAVGFRSDCSACYELKHNLQSKNVETFFVLYDGKNHELIAIFKMSGADIISRLEHLVPKEGEKAKKVSISLAAFMESGEEVFLDFIDSVGVINWERRIYERFGRNPTESSGYWNQTRTARLALLWTTGVKLDVINAEFGDKTKKALQSRAKYLGLKRPQNQ